MACFCRTTWRYLSSAFKKQMLSNEHSFNKYQSASYIPDFAPDTEDAMNTPTIYFEECILRT